MARRKRIIGIHTPTYALSDHGRRVITGLLRYVEEHPTLAVCDFRYAHENELIGSPPWTGKVDGMVIAVGRQQGLTAWLKRGKVPVVVVVADLADSGLASVITDPRSIARLAADHLLEGGYQKVAFVGYKKSDGSHRRRKALEEELARRGIRLRSLEIDTVPTGTPEDIEDPARLDKKLVSLLSNSKKPLGVVALNDGVAAMIVRLAHDLKLKIPDEVGVLGVDDTDAARISDPPISSIRTPGEQIGYRAAALLHQMMDGRQPARRIMEVPAIEVVARRSTAGWQRAKVTDIERAREYIRQHACDGVRLRDVASAVRIPVRTLELQFKAAVGHSLGEEIRNVRLARAKHLLETTELTTQRIAALVGYSHYSYLNRLLRDDLGLTPIEYRNQHR